MNEQSMNANQEIENQRNEQSGMDHKNSSLMKWIIRGILLAAIAVCLTLGIAGGGFQDVKNKAIRICYECIGIG